MPEHIGDIGLCLDYVLEDTLCPPIRFVPTMFRKLPACLSSIQPSIIHTRSNNRNFCVFLSMFVPWPWYILEWHSVRWSSSLFGYLENRGRSQTTLTRFCPLLTTYLPPCWHLWWNFFTITLENLYNFAPMYLLLPLAKRGSKWGDFHWAMGCV